MPSYRHLVCRARTTRSGAHNAGSAARVTLMYRADAASRNATDHRRLSTTGEFRRHGRRRSVADGSGDRDAWSSGAMSEHAGASRMHDGLQSEQANLQVEQARMMLG